MRRNRKKNHRKKFVHCPYLVKASLQIHRNSDHSRNRLWILLFKENTKVDCSKNFIKTFTIATVKESFKRYFDVFQNNPGSLTLYFLDINLTSCKQISEIIVTYSASSQKEYLFKKKNE